MEFLRSANWEMKCYCLRENRAFAEKKKAPLVPLQTENKFYLLMPSSDFRSVNLDIRQAICSFLEEGFTFVIKWEMKYCCRLVGFSNELWCHINFFLQILASNIFLESIYLLPWWEKRMLKYIEHSSHLCAHLGH